LTHKKGLLTSRQEGPYGTQLRKIAYSGLPGLALPALNLPAYPSVDSFANHPITNLLRAPVIRKVKTASISGAIGKLCTVNAIAIFEFPGDVVKTEGREIIVAVVIAVDIDIPFMRRDGSRKD
jgi:hypothetical protein